MDPKDEVVVDSNAVIGDTGADQPGTGEDNTLPESRRDVLAAAFEAAEAESAEEGDISTDKPAPKSPTDKSSPTDLSTTGKPGDKPDTGKSTVPTDKSDLAPAGWKTPAKSKWAAVDPEVRQEVLRRERETAQVVSQNEGARRFTAAMSNVMGPHIPRLQSMGVQPHQAVEALLRSDMILSQGAPAARAEKIAKMIKDYGVDINLLDAALSGQLPTDTAAPIVDRVGQMLDQRLAPMTEFMRDQQLTRAQQVQQEEQQLLSEVDNMEANPEKYPHFSAIREDMADIIELSAKKGVYLTTEQAYNKAIGMNPEISAQVASARALETRRVAAAAGDARARKAQRASLSVAGSANGAPTGYVPPATDRRGTIAAAFDSLDGR